MLVATEESVVHGTECWVEVDEVANEVCVGGGRRGRWRWRGMSGNCVDKLLYQRGESEDGFLEFEYAVMVVGVLLEGVGEVVGACLGGM